MIKTPNIFTTHIHHSCYLSGIIKTKKDNLVCPLKNVKLYDARTHVLINLFKFTNNEEYKSKK